MDGMGSRVDGIGGSALLARCPLIIWAASSGRIALFRSADVDIVDVLLTRMSCRTAVTVADDINVV